MPEEQVVTNREDGWRLDKFLSEKAPQWVSRTAIQRHIKEGGVLVNGEKKKASYRVKTGDIVTYTFPEKVEPGTVEPENIPLNIIYEDHDIIVVNKPPDMIVHPVHNKTTGTLVNALLNYCDDLQGIGGVMRPGIVHRLDKETSGVIVVAKNDRAHNSLVQQFKARTTEKYYLAIARGKTPPKGEMDFSLARHPVNRLKMTVSASGKEAHTTFKTITHFGNIASLVLAKPRTGRTHQIRVHFKEIGHPLLGDKLYGRHKDDIILGAERHMLHALQISINHPRTGDRMTFVARVPEDMVKVIRNLFELRRKQS